MVGRVGLEPTILAEEEFKSSAYTIPPPAHGKKNTIFFIICQVSYLKFLPCTFLPPPRRQLRQLAQSLVQSVQIIPVLLRNETVFDQEVFGQARLSTRHEVFDVFGDNIGFKVDSVTRLPQSYGSVFAAVSYQ